MQEVCEYSPWCDLTRESNLDLLTKKRHANRNTTASLSLAIYCAVEFMNRNKFPVVNKALTVQHNRSRMVLFMFTSDVNYKQITS